VSAETAKTPLQEEFLRSREGQVIERVRAIPEGFVRTYGDVSPGAPRYAGAVLFGAEEPDLAWWRVVRADGSLAKGERQCALLRAEGVPFRGARVDMTAARLGEGIVSPAPSLAARRPR
jgi:alkylated DNA nucleotide flippase Atl1